MGKSTEKDLIKGRIDDIGRLFLTPSQMEELNFVENEMVFLDFNDEGIIIAKTFAYSLAYDCIKVMCNGVHIGRDICRSKLLMTEDRKIVESITTKVCDINSTYLKGDVVDAIYYNIEYWIDNDRIVIPLTDEQRQVELRILRAVDELGRILIPDYLRNLHDLKTETGIEVRGCNIIISNNIERKTKINELGMITIPKEILEVLEIEPKMELEVETSASIILSKLEKGGSKQGDQPSADFL